MRHDALLHHISRGSFGIDPHGTDYFASATIVWPHERQAIVSFLEGSRICRLSAELEPGALANRDANHCHVMRQGSAWAWSTWR